MTTTSVPSTSAGAPAPAVSDPAAQTAAFFDALYGYAPDDLHTLLWTLQDKKSTWVPLRYGTSGGPDCVTERARTLADSGKDVYVAVSLADKPGMHDTRIKSANASGIVGMWADLDIADPDVHKKWNLPPTVDAAMELIDAAGMEPTLVVHSGHGLQAWWLFNEFWAFNGEPQRLEAAGLAQRWNGTLQARAAERQWVVDSTFDLARVMRVPGTLNRKGAPVMPVRLLSHNGPRYQPDDFDRFFVDPSHLSARGLTPARSYKPDEFEVSEGNKLDFELLQALLDNDDRFKATWDRARKDFSDQSASSYDLSLMTLAARAGWPDSQLGALVYQFRKRHNLDPAKALRQDYIFRTIGRARDDLARDDSSEAIGEVGDALDVAKRSGDDEQVRDARRDALDVVGQQIGIEVLHLIKYMADPPSYALSTPVGEIPLGGSDGFLTWLKFRSSVASYANELVPRFKAPEWDNICQLLLKAIEEQDVGAEATDRGEVASWLSAYLSQRPPVDTLEEATGSEYPFKDKDGRVMLFGPALKRWLYLTYQEKLTHKDLGRRLRSFGCRPDRVNVVDDAGKRTTRGVWQLPAGVL